ncbi:MAG: response regulator [Thiotrichaceae bacterium]|nr:response regulator [Thiotrichaceae bacterium]
MHTNTKILFVDDEPREVKYFKKAFGKEFTIETADSADAAKQILKADHDNIAIVITDHRMPKEVGLELLKYSQNKYPSIVRMLTTAFCDVGTAINAINDVEVYKYIPKPWNLNEFENVLRDGIQRFQVKKEQPSASSQNILDEFINDCNHWLDYSLHAYGDEYVYRSGIEALACQYQIKIKKLFTGTDSSQYSNQLTNVINKNFLSEDVLKTIKIQENSIFANIAPTISQRKH